MMKELASPRLELMKRDVPAYQRCSFSDWTRATEVIAARSEFSLGIGAFNATINDDLPDSRFSLGGGRRSGAPPPDTLLIRGDVQLSDRALVPIEQFSLGGLESVRGYRQDLY